MTELALNERQYLELEKLGLGAFAPLQGFMTETEFRSVVSRMRLSDDSPFPLPVTLDVNARERSRFRAGQELALTYEGIAVGTLQIESIFECDKASVASQVFGTSDLAHPGVAHFFRMGDLFLGGPVTLSRRVTTPLTPFEYTPEETRAYFRGAGWKSIVGFQTRNVPHRAHEYLQRLALEQADGLFVQPLVGARKRGDYTPEAILTAYRCYIAEFLPTDRVLLGILSTSMRYAGPREAVFHAIVRRNYGCTHFVVGRDHAGVGGYYGKYDAHALTERFDGDLGIRVLRFFGPFHCARCDGIVTERTCPHPITAPESVSEVSGTIIRQMLLSGRVTRPELMRPEIVESVRNMPLFIESDAA